jgi:GMP reductase
MLEFIEIKKSIIEKNDKKVYDLEVEKDNSFVVGDGIIVHNCITRKQTGVGRPQLSTIIECADACHQVGGLCCSDGGITCPGDIGKAFGAGADFVMIGGLFAGCDEAEGDVVMKYYHTGEFENAEPDNWISSTYKPKIEPKKFKLFYGMSSTYAQEKFGNGKPDYRASEGRVTLVPYTGFAYETIEELLGGLRSTMTYIGARRLKDIPKQCVFYKVHNQMNRIFENNTIGK